MPQHTLAISPSAIAPKVHWIRHEKVILDFDLAALYGVEARALNQAVKRNLARFPDDFMFQLTSAEADEASRLVSQSVTPALGDLSNSSQIVMSSRKHRGRSYLPYAFTEQGVAMLSSVLRSTRAVQVNIAIMRTFVQLRRLMDSNRDLARRIDSLEKKYDEQFRVVFDAIKRLIAEDKARKSRPRREIGFHAIVH
jgi:DNA-binding PadR family transcriptional regulator